MKHPEKKRVPFPRLSEDVKEMNGRSTKRLTQCIDALADLLEEKEEVQHEEATDEHRPLRDTGTE